MDIEQIGNLVLEGVGLGEEHTQEQVPPQAQAPPQRNKARRPSFSQSVDDEPTWVGGFFDHLSIIESNFNNRFDQVDTRLDWFEHRMDHMEYGIHQLYAYHNIQCLWSLPPPSSSTFFLLRSS